MFGFLVFKIRDLAYQLTVKNEIQHRFHCEDKMADWHWWYNFRVDVRPELALRIAEGASFDRQIAFTKKTVSWFLAFQLKKLQEII